MLGQSLVEVGVVCPQQVHDVVVVAHLRFEEQLGLPLHGLAQVVVEYEEPIGVRRVSLEIPHRQPLLHEVVHPPCRLGIGQETPRLPLEHVRVVKATRLGQLPELFVGNALPQEERKPRGELDIADPIDVTGGRGLRIVLDAEQERR